MSEITANKEQQNKYKALKRILTQSGKCGCGFFKRGGLYVSFLKTQHTMCWGINVSRLLPCPVLSPKRELEEAKTFCEKEGIRHITVESEELEIEGFCQNPDQPLLYLQERII